MVLTNEAWLQTIPPFISLTEEQLSLPDQVVTFNVREISVCTVKYQCLSTMIPCEVIPPHSSVNKLSLAAHMLDGP